MRSKGAVKFFAIALALVCIFQLSFTFIANQWDKKADRYAKGNIDMKRRYLDSAGRKPIMNIGLRKYNYMDVKERALNLGLDLRGGMHVTMEVAMNELIQKLSNNNDDPGFLKALGDAKNIQRTSQRNYIDIFYDEFKKDKPGQRLASYFATLENKAGADGISASSTDGQVLTFLRVQAKSALDRTFNIIRTRIDKFGVTQPNITLDENTGRIVVELPGADDPTRVRKYLQGSAKLEFYQTYTFAELSQQLVDADRTLMLTQEATKAGRTASDSFLKAQRDSTAHVDKIMASKDPKDSAERVKLAAIKQAPKDQPLIKLLVHQKLTEDMAKSPVMGYVELKDTGKINKYLAMDIVKSSFPSDAKFAWQNKPIGEGGQVLELIALRTTGIPEDPAILGGEVIIDARKDVNPQSNSYEVSMQMNTEGAREWSKITRDNINKFIAIVLDNQVYSAPRVNGEIPGGRSQITGNFTANDAGDLANILKAGKLPVRLDIIEEAVVGPSLGAEAIQSGLYSLLAGLVLIIVFMAIYYNRSGWVANLALLINLFFILGVLTSLNAALTLPGIAGIVLTLATAVDANVLIYERIRDELLEGKNMKLAISEGFRQAMSSILDANIVSLLLGIILLTFGSGPIYGFAVILVIGILTSLFSSILITRLIFDWLLEKDSKIDFGNNFLLRNINFDFVGRRRTFYIISGITIVIGIVSLMTRGLNYGVDFEGGSSYVVQFDKPVKTGDVRNLLTKPFNNSAPEVKTFGSDSKIDITTDYLADQGAAASEKLKNIIINELKPLGKVEIISEQRVGATIANDIKTSALSTVGFALLMIFVYMIIRFKHWQFALGATVALAHDILFVLTFFSLLKDVLPFSLDVDQAIIAALLTIAGYSMNDTVVVFDRIREYLNNNKKAPMAATINEAINKTLSRTVITSFTIFVVVLVLFIFGGQIIKGFAFAMLIGIIVGTYSSIFVATPIVVDFQPRTKEIPATV